MPMFELRFRAADHVDVPNPFTEGRGRVGKTYDAEADRWVLAANGEQAFRVSKSDLRAHAVALRDAVRLGEIACCDKATADALGVPFTAAAAKAAPKTKD